MTGFKTLVTDVHAIAAQGDLSCVATRVTDLEAAWDDAEDKLRPLDEAQWGGVDGEINAVLKARRAAAPDTAKVPQTLAALQTALDIPGAAIGSGGVRLVFDSAVTNAGGHRISRVVMRKELDNPLALKPSAEATAVSAKASERCTADDDRHAVSARAQARLRSE